MEDQHLTHALRLASLERRMRLLSGLALSLLVLLTASAVLPQGEDTVRAARIELVDASGNVRAELAIDGEGAAGLFVRDGESRVRASLTHHDSQTALYLLDEHGEVRVGAAQYAHGGGGFAAHGPGGKGAAVLYFKESGSVTFFDAEGGVIERVPQ